MRELQSGIADYRGGGQLDELPHHQSQPLPLMLSKFLLCSVKALGQVIKALGQVIKALGHFINTAPSHL